jgi:hypothetical protein
MTVMMATKDLTPQFLEYRSAAARKRRPQRNGTKNMTDGLTWILFTNVAFLLWVLLSGVC